MAGLALSAALLCAATDIVSVRSTDHSKTSNTVVIELSEPAQYSTEPLPGGKGVRLTIRDVGSLAGSPHYPRLSEVIDVVSARLQNGDAIIEIKTMGDCDIDYGTGPGRRQIAVFVAAPGAGEADTDAAVVTPAVRPRKVDQPQAASRLKPTPKPVSEPESGIAGGVEAPAPGEPEPSDQPASGLPALPRPDSAGARAETGRSFPLPWLVILVAALLCLWVIIRFMLRKSPAADAASAGTANPADPAAGTTLLLDPETRLRLVRKLRDQGWSSQEIAREMRLDVKEVEEICARLKAGRR